MLTAQRGQNTTITRNSSHFKPVRDMVPTCLEEEREEEEDDIRAEAEVEEPNQPTLAAPTPADAEPATTMTSRSLPSPFQSPKKTLMAPRTPKVVPDQRPRPQRQRQPPAYLKDYETK
ncbi:hypothetical protein ACOMHN_021057 [Nucella lapillus]